MKNDEKPAREPTPSDRPDYREAASTESAPGSRDSADPANRQERDSSCEEDLIQAQWERLRDEASETAQMLLVERPLTTIGVAVGAGVLLSALLRRRDKE